MIYRFCPTNFVFPSRARRLRKALGGGMRQCGIIAAAGIVSLDSMINRLAEDHANCLKLATGTTDSFFKYAYKPNKLFSGIAALKHPFFNVNVSGTHTNILIFEVNQKVDANQFCKELQEVKSIYLSVKLSFHIMFLQSTEKQIEALGGNDVSVRAVPFGPRLVRMVLNHHVTSEMIDSALQKIALVIQEYK